MKTKYVKDIVEADKLPNRGFRLVVRMKRERSDTEIFFSPTELRILKAYLKP